MNTLLALTGIGVIAMLSEIFKFRKALYPVVLIGLVLALGLSIADWDTNIRYFSDMMFFDNYAIAFSGVMIATTLIWFLLNSHFIRGHSHEPDYTALVVFSLAGAVVMVSYADLTMFFIGLEILSIAMYVMASSSKMEMRSNEAGFKYFILGAFATGFLLFGIALIYGATGSFNLQEIAAYSAANIASLPAFYYAGILLIMVGLSFKIAAAPFHFWAPDVYEGAPTPVTAYMATVVKTAAFAAFLRLFSTAFSGLNDWWGPVIATLSAISMLAGNIMAVYQKSLKRMLAFSSISHAGYMLMTIVALNDVSKGALLLYTTAYSMGSIGIFAIVISMSKNYNENISSLKGFASMHKWPALFITIFMLSLAGIPPVSGFFAKYYVFTGALKGDYLWLVGVAVISSLIGVYYYFKVIITIFQPADKDSVQMAFSANQILVMWITVIITLALGLIPGLIIYLI